MLSLLNKSIPMKYRYFTTWGRTALYGALKALDVMDSEVLVPAFTCNTTVVDAILQVGAKPIFVDIKLPSLDLNLSDLKRKISPKSKVLISHHYYGYVSRNLNEVKAICRKYDLWHIEDCAHSLGAKLGGQLTGAWGDVAIYSFSKTMVNPGGGCIATDNRELFTKVSDHYAKNKPIDRLFKNWYCFNYWLNIARDLHDTDLLITPTIYLSKIIIFLLRYLIKYDKDRILGKFYETNGLKTKEVVEYINISMTYLQGFYIRQKLRKIPEQLARRQNLFKALQPIIPHAIDCSGMEAAYGCYLFKTPERNKMVIEARKRGIRLRGTWPAFQNYWEVQKTDNVKSLAENYLLLNMGQYCHEKYIPSITKLFYEYQY
jgi:hypothetical protein